MRLHLKAFGTKPHRAGGEDPQQAERLAWRKSSYDNGEFCSSDMDPQLKTAVLQNGKTVLGKYEYSLSGDGKWLKRKPRIS